MLIHNLKTRTKLSILSLVALIGILLLGVLSIFKLKGLRLTGCHARII